MGGGLPELQPVNILTLQGNTVDTGTAIPQCNAEIRRERKKHHHGHYHRDLMIDLI